MWRIGYYLCGWQYVAYCLSGSHFTARVRLDGDNQPFVRLGDHDHMLLDPHADWHPLSFSTEQFRDSFGIVGD